MKALGTAMHVATNHEHLDLTFNQLYANHLAMVRSVVRLFNFRDAAADDLVQDIFILAWKKRNYLKDHEALPAWLKTIARNQCVNLLRSQKRQQRYLVSFDAFSSEVEAPESPTLLDISLMQFEEHMAVLEDLILSHDHSIRREAARLFYLEHKSVQAVAQDMQLNLNTVLSHLRRFRLIVTKAMQQWMAEQADNYEPI